MSGNDTGLEVPEPEVRVLHLLATLRPSGMERMLVSAAEPFRQLGVRGLVVGQGAGHSYETELRRAGYSVRIIPSVRTLHGMLALQRLIRHARPDVIHVHTEGFFLPTVVLCAMALRSRSIVHTVHNVFDGPTGWRVRRRIQTGVGDRLLAAVVVPSTDVGVNERRSGRRTVLIWNWVDRRFFRLSTQRGAGGRTPGSTRFLLVGNCNEAKNHRLALEAIAGLDASVLHLGDESSAEAEERRMLDELEAAGRLPRRGPQPPDDAMIEADAFLMPSRNEGMGVALAEAMTAGLPSFVADAPGLRWAAGEPGVRMVDLRPDAWRRELSRFDPERGPGEAASRIDFSPERGASEYAALYRKAAERGRR